jgi:hypothetical protein
MVDLCPRQALSLAICTQQAIQHLLQLESNFHALDDILLTIMTALSNQLLTVLVAEPYRCCEGHEESVLFSVKHLSLMLEGE